MSKQPGDFSKRHVFISYKHDDLDFAENVQNRLLKAGFAVWIDSHIQAGQEWRVQIDQAIKNALAMVVIMTPEAKASEYVTYEWSFAVGIGLKIIPIKHKQTPLHPRLEAFQFLDFTNGMVRPWDRLIAEIEEATQSSLASANTLPEAAIPSFIQQVRIALNSTSGLVRQDAIATLSHANSAEAREMLLEALSHPLVDVRKRAALVFKEQPYQPAIPRLIELLQDSTHNVRSAAISAIEASKDRRALPSLLEILPHADDSEKPHIVRVLGAFGDISVIPILLAVYEKSKDSYLHVFINQTFGELRSEQAIPALNVALQDTDDTVCESAGSALISIGTQEAMQSLLDALIVMSSMRCEKIVSTLHLGFQQEEAFIAFLDAIYQKHHLPAGATGSVREKAAQLRRRVIAMLHWRKSNKAIPTLLQSMDDEDLVVQQETVLAFKAIQDKRSLPALMTILRWRFDYYDEETLLYALQTLAQIGDSSVIPQLKAILNETLDKHTELAVQVISVFGKIGIYETLDYLRQIEATLKRRDHPPHEITDAIAQSLKEIRSRCITP